MASYDGFSSTFVMDEELFREYYAAKERRLNRADGRGLALLAAVLVVLYVVGTVFWGRVTPLGIVVGAALVAFLVVSVLWAVTGATVFWPERAWRKTYQRYFTRHGVDSTAERPWSFELETCARPYEVVSYVLKRGRAGQGRSAPYKAFSHVEETEHLVVLCAADETGTMMQNLFSSSYADNLAKREEREDMVFAKEGLKGGAPDELVAFLMRKVGQSA